MDHSQHIHFRLPLNPPRSLQHDNLKQPWDLSNLMNKWPHSILTEIDVAEKSIDACSEADDIRAIATNDTDMTTVPGIASEEFSNSDLGDIQANDRNIVTDLNNLGNLHEELMFGTTPMSSAGASPAVHRVSGMIEATKESLCDSRNAQIWLQSLDMVRIVCWFPRSERTRNWKLHLQVLHKMMPFLASAGHNSYTKVPSAIPTMHVSLRSKCLSNLW